MAHKTRGSALALVLVVFAALSILGTAMLGVSIHDTKKSESQEKNLQAYYIARSGADAVASYIINNPGKIDFLKAETPASPVTGNLNNDSFSVVVKNGSISGEVLIQSTGKVYFSGSLIVEKTIKLTLSDISSNLLNYMIFSSNAPEIGNNATIEGNLGTNAKNIDYNRNPIKGDITLGSTATQSDIDNAKANQASNTPSYKVEKLSSVNTFPMTDPSKFTTAYDSSYRFKDGDKIYAYTSNLTNLNMSNIAWDSNEENDEHDKKAQLHLFVSNSMQIDNVNPPGGISVYIYYNGTDDITSNNGNFSIENCYIYAPKATFSKNGGGNGSFLGSLIVQNCILSNSHSNFKYDQNLSSYDLVGGKVYKRTIWSY